MKWFKNTAYGVIEALEKIFNQNYQADKIIQKLLKSNKKWGSRDRKMISKALYDIVRWKRKYEYLSGSDINTLEGKWRILTLWSILNEIHVPDWFQVQTTELLEKIKIAKEADFDIEQSIPEWLYQWGKNEMGKEEFEKEIKALNKEAETIIRVNTLKTDIETLQKILLKKGIKTFKNPDFPEALVIEGKPKLTHLDCYKKGLFEIQDASSQMVAEFINPKPGQKVIDACAGAGGKSLHLAAKMKNQGEIIAMDIYPQKLKELKKRAKRNGVKNIKETSLINSDIIEKHKNSADILLLDVPCSSLGTLKRKPGLKWELTPDKIKRIRYVQKDILNKYPQMLKPGGELIYVTCSILPSENKKQIKEFLKQNKNFTFVEEKSIKPSKTWHDGFYMAKLKKLN